MGVRAGDEIVRGIVLTVDRQHELLRGGADDAQRGHADEIPVQQEIQRCTEQQHDTENDAQRGREGQLTLARFCGLFRFFLGGSRIHISLYGGCFRVFCRFFRILRLGRVICDDVTERGEEGIKIDLVGILFFRFFF